MSERIVCEFQVESFKKIPNPFYGEKDEPNNVPQMYTAICDVRNIPENIPTKTNPREQNLNTKVAKKIKASLLGTDSNFYILNRGIVLSAESVSYNACSKVLTIVFSDLSIHGNVDGGHTLKVILENRSSIDDKIKQFVKLEILTGIEDFFQDLAEARNTSTQVKDPSIINLKGGFDLIKQVIEEEPYHDNISYKENDEGDISIGEILAILNLFNIEKYPVTNDKSFPIISYSGNQKCIDYYNEAIEKDLHDNAFTKMKPIMLDIFRLYDHLECNMSRFYKSTTSNGKYGSIKGVVTAKDGKTYHSKFYQNDILHQTAKGLIMPVLASLRAVVEEDENGNYKWAMNPFDLLEDVGPDLVFSVVDRSRTLGNNPNAVGKDTQQWKTLFQAVLIKKFQTMNGVK